jgi:hypothetical protein
MLGHMIGQIKTKTAETTNARHDFSTNPDHCREQVVATINDLHALSRRGLWGILLFLSISAATLYGSVSGLFSSIPAEVRELFGEAPPLGMLHLVLGVSWLSALVLILGRRGRDGKPAYNWCNIGLPTAFYPLYIFYEPSGTHFPAVFAAGLLLLVIEHLTVTCYAARVIREETERLNHLHPRT